jgi:glutamate/tyrosine decarboxylase-like PLP-dependent enzyme
MDIDFLNKLIENLIEIEERNPVAPVLSPEEIYQKVDLDLHEDGIDDEALQSLLTQVFEYTPKTATSLFFNQLFGGRHSKAVIGDMMACMLNNSMYTYKVGGPMVLIEKKILEEVQRRINYPSHALGTFAPGGSMTNFMALLMARDNFNTRIPHTGDTSKMILYTSETSHYSIPKNAALAGVGRDGVRFVETDEEGRMRPDVLEAMIKEDVANGYHPFLVNATAGTTVLGAFDDLNAIADITDKYPGIWLHVDGAYCGSVLWSKKYRHLIDGCERSDSFSVNAHKMLGTPLSCSMIVSKHPEALYRSFSNEASYLYQTDDDNLNPGKISLQCGRRNDALKFFTLWKSIGSKGLEAMVDHQFHLANYASKYIKSNPNYELYSFDDTIGICFNYKGVSPEEVCLRLYQGNKLVVGHGSHKGKTFVRLVSVNSNNTEKDIDKFFEIFENFVESEMLNPVA